MGEMLRQALSASRDGMISNGKTERENYFLVVSRLVPYKRIDILIEAFNSLGWSLVIIGDGTERRTLNGWRNQTSDFFMLI